MPNTTYEESMNVRLSALKRLAQRTDTRLDALEGAGYQTAQNVTDAISTRISSTYKAAGSVTFAGLPTADAAHEGFVYNVTDADGFTTTDAFVEGAGNNYPAGTNVVVVVTSAADAETKTYGYDVLAGFVDLSGYQQKVSGATNGHFAALDANGQVADSGKNASDFVEKVLVDGVEDAVVRQSDFATDAQVEAMLDEVYGVSTGS